MAENAAKGRAMDIGTFLLMQSPSGRSSNEIYARAIEQAQAAEALGFRNVWLAEHHFSTYGYVSRPLQLATYIAAKTTRVRVGTAVVVVPLHHPLIVAEEIATLDVLSGGRADIGLGRGYQRYEFERFGLKLDTDGARWDESLDILLKAFEGKPFTYGGKVFNVPETSIYPKVVQQPRPPVWITAQSEYSIQAAARRGLNVLTGGFGVSVDRLREFGQFFSKVAGEKPARERPLVGVQRAVYVTKDAADARDAAEHARWNMRVTLSLRNNYERVENGKAVPVPAQTEPTLDELLDRYLIIGTPETCVRQIRRVQELVGISHFNCSFWFGDMDQARVLRSMQLFSQEVMPAFA
jgi:luciferase family oxidoreductase group 1